MTTSREFWGTISIAKSEMAAVKKTQMGVYTIYRDNSNKSAVNAVVSGLVIGTALKYLQASTATAAGLGVTLYNLTSAMETDRRKYHADTVYYGHTILEELEDALNRNSSYTRIEAYCRLRQYTASDGSKITVVIGNSQKKGENGTAYRIERIQLSNGSWITY